MLFNVDFLPRRIAEDNIESWPRAQKHLGKGDRKMQDIEASEILLCGLVNGNRHQVTRKSLPVLEWEADDSGVLRNRLGGDQIAEHGGSADGLICLSDCLAGGRDVRQSRVVNSGQPVERSGRLAE